MKTKKVFISEQLTAFLLEENVYEQFVKNAKAQNTEKLLKKIGLFEDIWTGFEWEKSPEGHKFWENLACKFDMRNRK